MSRFRGCTLESCERSLEFGVCLQLQRNSTTPQFLDCPLLYALLLAKSHLLAGLSSGAQGGTAYGVFNNSEDMALNLGFTGFRRGSYDFYKTDWKYLNDKSTRGNVGTLKGLLIPAGTSSVYDQNLGSNVRRPFLHVRYRASQADDRK